MEDFVEELKLGDVIKLSGKLNGIFLITFIDDDKIQIENETEKIVLPIEDQKIDGIDIILEKRNPEEGYARQNGLLEGVWINITFNIDGELQDINGEILSLEEDCIEIKVYPTNEIVYIDFGYNGIPEHLNISEITIQNNPQIAPQINLQATDNQIDSLIEDGDRIGEAIGRKKMKEITEYVNVSDSRKRFSLEEQTNDLLEDLLSSIPIYERTTSVLNGINTIIERYVQLRKEFSIIDEDKITYIKHGANYRPLVQSLMKFKKALYWLIPVTEIIKKNVIEIEDEMIDETFVNIEKLNEIIINFRTIHIDNRFAVFTKELQKWFAPFLQITENKNIITIGTVEDNFKVVVNNGKFETVVVNCKEECKLDTKKMFSIRYNDNTEYLNPSFIENSNNPQLINLFDADVLYLKSLLTLPEPFARFSCVTLPGTTIMEKSNMGRFFINYNELFKMRMQNVNVTPYLKKSLKNEDNGIKGSLYQNSQGIEKKFLSNIKNYFLNMNEVNRDELFEDYLSEVIPQTKQLFQLMKKYIHGKLSIVQIIKFLEPFLIYSSDITFQQYKEMADFLNSEVSKYIKTYNEGIEIFRKLKNHEEQFSPNALVEILDDSEIADIYMYGEYPNMSSSEFLNIVIFTDYGDLFNNKIRYDSRYLTDSLEKIKQTAELSQNTCKAIHLVKHYKSLDDLENDNNKTIFYDAEFDKTPYYLLTNHQQERQLMQEEDFYLFLETILKNKYSIPENEIKYVISAFQNGKREVDENKNVYAMIFNKLEGKIDYYTRQEKTWKKDDSIKDQPVTDELACILQENCVISNSECVSDNVAKEEYVKTAIAKISSEFDKNIALSRGENDKYVKDLYETSLVRIKFLKKIKNYNIAKYNYDQYDLGLDIMDENIIISPYIKKRDFILGESDIVKKYEYILDFVSNYTVVMTERHSFHSEENPDFEQNVPENLDEPGTPDLPRTPDSRDDSDRPRTPDLPRTRDSRENSDGPRTPDLTDERDSRENSRTPESLSMKFNKVLSAEISDEEFIKYIVEKDERMHWLFCKKTKTKLLPKFFYILAKTFVDSPDQFLSRLDKLCNSIGKLSDDGDKYVDKYSGYTIRHIDFMREFGEAEEEIIDFELPVQTNLSEIDKKIINIVSGMENTMQIFLNEDELIITIVNYYLEIMDSKLKEEYKKKIAKKGVEETYEFYLNGIIMYLTLAAFVFAIQVHVPGIKFRSIAGCGRFKGNPITEQNKLIDYIACVAAKMSKGPEPWNVLTTLQTIVKKIRFYHDRFASIPQNDLKMMMDDRKSKKEYVEEIDEPIFYTKWVHFLPAIVPIRMPTVLPMEKMDVLGYIKKGDARQFGILSAIKSKIIFYSYMFQQKMQDTVQEIVSNQHLLFYNKSNIPFLDNACCNDKTGQSTLSYFTDINPEIAFINQQVKRMHFELRYSYNLTQSTLFSDINTKNIILSSSNKYSEYTIIRYLMINNKFATINDDENEYKEKTNKAMANGFSFTEKEFLGAIQENITIDFPIIDDPPLSMKQLFEKHTPSSISQQDTTKINNILALMKESKIKKIKAFLAPFRPSKETINTLDDLLDWNGIFVNYITFIQKYVYLFSRVFPNIIINSVVQDGLIHSYWDLSKTHMDKISTFCVKYYEPLEKFRTKINPLLERVLDETKDIYEMSINAPFMEEYTTLLINVNYLLDVLTAYVTIAETGTVDEENYLGIGKMQTIKKTTASLVGEYMKYIQNSGAILSDYQDITKHGFEFKQSEKQEFRKRLEMLTVEERKVDSELRKAGLGKWNKGLKKSVFQYEKDDSDNEMEPIDEGEELESFEDEKEDVIIRNEQEIEGDDESLFFDIMNKEE